MKLEIYCEDRPWVMNGVAVWMIGTDQHGRRFRVKPMEMVFEPMEDDGKPVAPTLEFAGEMSRQFFPALISALENSGHLRPKKDESASALKYHLEDMRRLVFNERDAATRAKAE